MSATTERFPFVTADGTELDGRLERPPGVPRGVALFAHCFTCSKQSPAAVRISRALANAGLAGLRFDFTGLGESGGDFAATTFASNVADLEAAAGALAERGLAPQLLIGHSLGGAAVLAAARRIEGVRAVATIGAPSDPAHVLTHLGGALERIRSEGAAEVTLGGRRVRIGRAFVEELEERALLERVHDLKTPLLVLHAPRDDIVGIEHAGRIFVAARHPKSFISLEPADHLLTRHEDADYAAAMIATWAARHLQPAQAEADAAEPAEGEVEVAETGQGRFVQAVRIGHHHLTADEPASSGGQDLGPSPYDFLLAGLGACTSMTLRLYAEHKKLPLERVRVVLRHRKVHARDCADCETKEGKLDEIERRIFVQGDLDEAQRRRLLEIADRCPVHRTLEGEVKVRSRLEEGA